MNKTRNKRPKASALKEKLRAAMRLLRDRGVESIVFQLNRDRNEFISKAAPILGVLTMQEVASIDGIRLKICDAESREIVIERRK